MGRKGTSKRKEPKVKTPQGSGPSANGAISNLGHASGSSSQPSLIKEDAKSSGSGGNKKSPASQQKNNQR